ncbi:uncharacterized protein BCR38DRAFT_330408 [Pseudomassariella vexata]|uniref:AB hydrolase-1 domain-containing protein n=1 Tax=Pseudomassariella vexata TaxID=1141098 RepID=A0A1Y2EIH6_9PEZI|nr:uncharacterized protein BCR38DRAFT_330408 [Pseudomassariella vexata]ORY71378.1 hypothetical protein BCR38DRAFT_330408 [Pseudomassariella vexata]
MGWTGLICFCYFLLALEVFGLPGISHPVSIAIESYGMLEILWYLFWFLPYKSYLQKPGIRLEPMTRAQRRAMIRSLLNTVPDILIFLRGWFAKAHLDEIYREDVMDWMLWALWGTESFEGVDMEEMDEYIQEAEIKAGSRLRPGRGGAKPIRVNIDPVKMVHRSLLFYGLIGFLDVNAAIFMFFQGFSFWRQPRSNFFKVFPPRLQTLASLNASAAPEFSYFYRRHKCKRYRPIVFCHGIGIGLATYIPWLMTIPKDIGVLAIELLPVSGRICPEAASSSVFKEGMRKILSQQGIDDFVFVGHSYGTLLARPLLEDPVIEPMMNSMVLCDPVAILLHLPDVAYNMTRREPKTAPELEISWGAALDPRIAHTICRRLNWQEHYLLREHLIGRRTTAIVGSRDCVIHPDAVASYVYYGDVNYTSADVEEWKKTPEEWTGRGELELYYLYDRDHGQSLLIPNESVQITEVVEKYCRIDGGPDPKLGAKDVDTPEPPPKHPARSHFSVLTDSNMV